MLLLLLLLLLLLRYRELLLLPFQERWQPRDSRSRRRRTTRNRLYHCLGRDRRRE